MVPVGSLMEAANGRFYSTISGGLDYFYEVIIEWDPVRDTVIFRKSVNAWDYCCYKPLMQARNGKIYGTATNGGEYGKGILFEWDPVTGDSVTKHSFLATNERIPCSTLLELEHKSYGYLNIEACGSYTSAGSKVWTVSGEYTDTIPDQSGCDSIFTVNLTLYNADTDVTLDQDQGVLTSTASGATWQWIDCDNGNAPIDGETGHTFTRLKDGDFAVIVTQSECTDTSDCFEVHLTGRANNIFKQEVTVYPNPNDGSFTAQSRQGLFGCRCNDNQTGRPGPAEGKIFLCKCFRSGDHCFCRYLLFNHNFRK